MFDENHLEEMLEDGYTDQRLESVADSLWLWFMIHDEIGSVASTRRSKSALVADAIFGGSSPARRTICSSTVAVCSVISSNPFLSRNSASPGLISSRGRTGLPEHIFSNGEAAENIRNLERPPQSAADPFVWRDVSYIFTIATAYAF